MSLPCREGAYATRRIIFALFLANIILAIMLLTFNISLKYGVYKNIYNIPNSFFTSNAYITIIGVSVLLVDVFVLIILYEFISKLTRFVFLRLLLTILIVLSLDSFVFNSVIFYDKPNFPIILLSDLISKAIAAITYTTLFYFYITFIDKDIKKNIKNENKLKDIFNILIFKKSLRKAYKEKQLAEEELLVEKNKAQQYLDVAGVILLSLDALGTIQMINPKGCEILGYKKHELLGKNWFDICIPKDIREGVKNVTKQVFLGNIKPVRYYENEVVTKTGEKRLIAWHNEMIKDTDGKIINVLSSGEDITERKLANNMLQQSKQLLETTQSIAKVGGWELDIATNELFWTAETYRIHEITPDAFNLTLDGGVDDFLPESRRIISEALEAAITRGENYDLELEKFTAKGNRIDVRTTCEVIFSDGKPSKLTGIFHDITESKRNQEIKDVLFDIYKFRQKALDLNEIFPFIENRLKTLIDTTNFTISLFDEAKLDFKILYRSEKAVKDDKSVLQFKSGMTFSDQVIKTKKYFLSTQEVSKNLINKGVLEELGKKSKCWLGIPLIIDQNVIGLLKLQSYKDPKAFSINDLTFLELIADMLARIIKEHNDLEEIKKLSMAIDQSGNSVIITDAEANIEYVNPKFTEITGYTFDEVLGKNPRLWQSGKHSKGFYANMWRVLISGKAWQGVLINKTKEGRIFWENTTISPIKNEEGLTTHYLAIKEDITEQRKLTEEKLKAEEAYHHLFNNAPVALWDEDFTGAMKILDGLKKQGVTDLIPYLNSHPDVVKRCTEAIKIVDVNLEVIKLHQANNKKDLFADVAQLFTPQTFEVFKKELNALYVGEQEYETVAEIKTFKGEVRTVHIKFGIYKNKKGILDYSKIQLAMVDISEKVKAEKALKVLNKNLELIVAARTNSLTEANKELEAFSYSVSHDLRAPLTRIAGFSYAIKSLYADVIDKKGQHYLNRIEAAGKDMSLLIDDLLSLSKITRFDVVKSKFNISDLVFQKLEEIKINYPNLLVKSKIKTNIYINADRRLVTILIDNLLSNAVKFSNKNKEAIIEFGEKMIENKSYLFIKDNGSGFDMKYYDDLFIPFKRLHSGLDYKGTGIGLTIVKRVINKHNGHISIDSNLDKGTIVSFYL